MRLSYDWDDDLLNNEGADRLYGGAGNDLLVSATTCDGDLLEGAEPTGGDGAAKNDASWAQAPAGSGGTAVDLEKGASGSTYGAGGPAGAVGATDSLGDIDDVEGSSRRDLLFGDGTANHLIGHKGEDEMYGRAGDDVINSVDVAGAPEADFDGGGPGTDNCIHDSLDTLSSCP